MQARGGAPSCACWDAPGEDGTHVGDEPLGRVEADDRHDLGAHSDLFLTRLEQDWRCVGGLVGAVLTGTMPSGGGSRGRTLNQ